MNFNDIELRLRYPHLFHDEDPLQRGHAHLTSIAPPKRTLSKPNSQWIAIIRRLFRRVNTGWS